MALSLSGSVVPTGGMVLLTASGIVGGPLTYSRSFGSGAYTPIWVEPNPGPLDKYLDQGDGLPGPLPSNLGVYNYLATDGSGASAAVTGLTPYVALEIQPDWISATFVRGLQAGVAGIALPPGYHRPAVYHEMPKVGWPELPFILPMLAQMEQSQTQIGQDVPTTQLFPTTGAATQLQTISVMAKRAWRVELLTLTAGERDFWRDAILAIWTSLLSSVFQPVAQDMSHSWIVHQDQKAGGEMDPGFYKADLLLRFEGMYNVGLNPNYGPINVIAVSGITAGGSGFTPLPIATIVSG